MLGTPVRKKTSVGEVRYGFDDLSPDSWKSSGTRHCPSSLSYNLQGISGQKLRPIPLRTPNSSVTVCLGEKRLLLGWTCEFSWKEAACLIPSFRAESIERLGGRPMQLFPVELGWRKSTEYQISE